MTYVAPTHWAAGLGKAKTGRLQAIPLANAAPPLRLQSDALTVDAAQNDTIGLFEISTSARLSTAVSKLLHTALGTSVVAHVGFADDAELGIASKSQALAASLDVAAAGSKILVNALAAADLNKDVWQIIGLAADPKAKVLVILTLAGSNPASGTVAFEQGFYGA